MSQRTTHMHEGDFIDGRFSVPVTPDGERTVVCPADLDHVLRRVPYAASQVDAAVDAAARAFPAYAALPQDERRELLVRYQERLRAHRNALAITIALEVGKPTWEALVEVDAMIGKVDLTLGPGAEFTRDQTIKTLPGEIRYRPLGVMAVIGPFNFPGHLPNGHILGALLLGNTVVFKPSERTPGTAHLMAQCFVEAGMPPGVFNVVFGEAATGRALTTHASVDGILFTGSAAVGKTIVRDNVDHLSRLVALELGGKNPALVFDDCDLERTARDIAFSAFATAGQRCTATSRVVVTAGVADALATRLADLARGISIGHPLDPGTFMGPVISDAALAKLNRGRALAVQAGAQELVGQQVPTTPHRGHYTVPSIHRMPPSDVHLAGYTDEELFGPDVALQVVANEAEAFALANRGRYGLSASVFTADAERFERASRTLQVGVLHWNRPGAGASGRLPFSGIKGSGNHRPAGILTGQTCSFAQAVLLPKSDPGPLPSWPGFPASHSP